MVTPAVVASTVGSPQIVACVALVYRLYEMRFVTVLLAVEITETEPLAALATYTSVPVGLTAMPSGRLPTLTAASTACVAVFTASTDPGDVVLPKLLVTYAIVPAALSVTSA